MFTFNDLREKLVEIPLNPHTARWVTAAAVVQIAQELNEIKHLLARFTGATDV